MIETTKLTAAVARTMNLVGTNVVSDAYRMAYLFSACLAADKGVGSEVYKTDEGFVVVADDKVAVAWNQA